jgi:hypothetical protein
MMDEEGNEHDHFAFLLMTAGMSHGGQNSVLEEYDGKILISPRSMGRFLESGVKLQPLTYSLEVEQEEARDDEDFDDFIDSEVSLRSNIKKRSPIKLYAQPKRNKR